LAEPVVCMGISRKGISFPSLDGQPVHVVFLMIFPDSYRDNGIRPVLMKEMGIILRDRFLRERLKLSETPEEAFEIFIREAEHLIGPAERLKNIA
jgi:mannitol/fructose-specific phosphotransferase system IIA component (Ntr-type)